MVRGQIKGYCQCYKLFVTWLTTQLCSNYVVWPQIKCEAIKETQTRRWLLQQNIHPVAMFHT